MNLNEQVISLTQAKRLKELGFKKESLYSAEKHGRIENTADLEERVNEFIDMGYEPVGGLCIYNGYSYLSYYQTIYKINK